MIFRVTAIRPSIEFMPSIESYMALAVALHDESEMCNGNYQVPFDECGAREADIQDAVRILVHLHREGWVMGRDTAGTVPLGLTADPPLTVTVDLEDTPTLVGWKGSDAD